jgi:Ni,Fe-hydrogenase III large subunit
MDMVVQIGPQHLALAEPERFKIHTEGEKVVDVDVSMGYNHRGVEKLAERKTFEQDILLVERICGICSMSHPVAFTQAVEDIADVDIPERALYLRTIIAELERIHFPALLTTMEVVERRTEFYIDAFLKNRTIRARLIGTGVLTKEDAKKFCTVGPTARGSGYAVDVRKDDPHLAYDRVEWDEIVFDEGDNLARAKVRLLELFESTKIVRQSINALKELPEGDIAAPVPHVPPGESVGRYEAPRGEVFHYVKSNGTFYPERVKIRAPTYANIQALPSMLIGGTLADVPITLGSIDPCFSCTDR